MNSNRAKRTHRTPLWIGVSLLVLTIGIGAARIAPGTSGGGGHGSQLRLHFGAPDGGGVGFSG